MDLVLVVAGIAAASTWAYRLRNRFCGKCRKKILPQKKTPTNRSHGDTSDEQNQSATPPADGIQEDSLSDEEDDSIAHHLQTDRQQGGREEKESQLSADIFKISLENNNEQSTSMYAIEKPKKLLEMSINEITPQKEPKGDEGKEFAVPTSTVPPRTPRCSGKVNQTYIFLLTGMSTSEKNRCNAWILKLDGLVIHDSESPTKDYQSFLRCSHMICSNLIRSEKLFLALLGKKWILHTSYIEESVTAGYWLPEANYEWRTWTVNHPNRKYFIKGTTPIMVGSSLPGRVSDGLLEALNRWPHAGQGDSQLIPPFHGWKVALLVKENQDPLHSLFLTLGGAELLDTTATINQEIKAAKTGKAPFTHAFVLNSADTESAIGSSVPNLVTKLQEYGVPCLQVGYLLTYILHDSKKSKLDLSHFLIPKMNSLVPPSPSQLEPAFPSLSLTSQIDGSESQRASEFKKGTKRKSQGNTKSPALSRDQSATPPAGMMRQLDFDDDSYDQSATPPAGMMRQLDFDDDSYDQSATPPADQSATPPAATGQPTKLLAKRKKSHSGTISKRIKKENSDVIAESGSFFLSQADVHGLFSADHFIIPKSFKLFNLADFHKRESQGVLGRGSYSSVLRCKIRGVIYAVKALTEPLKGLNDATLKLSEATAVELKHTNIVKYYACVKVERHIYFVMEQCHPVEQMGQMVLAEHFRKMLKDLTQGLEYLHALGYIHRDIKPANILVDLSTKTFKLGDLGSIMKIGGSGSPGDGKFAAPEAVQGRPTTASDVYSLGKSLIFLNSQTMQASQCKFKHLIESMTAPKAADRPTPASILASLA